jgi:anti-sigma factor ChrR (cupin superfamily)
MIEKIEHEGRLIALIIPSSFRRQGVEFFTSDDSCQQLGYMSRKAGYVIPAHEHKSTLRTITAAQEVLIIKSGRIKIDLFHDADTFICSCIVQAGDVVMLASGGHGFEMLEDSEMIEVKQGPFAGANDKIVYQNMVA